MQFGGGSPLCYHSMMLAYTKYGMEIEGWTFLPYNILCCCVWYNKGAIRYQDEWHATINSKLITPKEGNDSKITPTLRYAIGNITYSPYPRVLMRGQRLAVSGNILTSPPPTARIQIYKFLVKRTGQFAIKHTLNSFVGP